MKLWHGVIAGLAMVSGAHAQASTIVSYCNSQYPDNAQGLVAPVNARNCSAYITNNLSTVPYTGQVSTVYPLVAMGANISGTVSATYLRGDGSQITGIGTASPTWGSISGIPTQVASVSNSGSISLTNLDIATLLRSAAVSVTGNISVNTINGQVPSFGGSPDWYTITSIPAYVRNVSSSGYLLVSGLGVTGNITATNITASGALIGGPTSVTTLLATGLFTGQAGANITGAVTLNSTLNGATVISTSSGGIVTTTVLNALTASLTNLTVSSCSGCASASTSQISLTTVLTSQTWIIPSGVTEAEFTLIGAGGGGGAGDNSTNNGCGGGGGAGAIINIAGLTPGAGISITVGNGGTAGGPTGGNGGSTTVIITPTTYIAGGGFGAGRSATYLKGGIGGITSNTTGFAAIPGGRGGPCGVSFSIPLGNGGQSMMGNGAVAVNSPDNAIAGTAYGSGGGGTASNASGGAGANGVVLIRYVK